MIPHLQGDATLRSISCEEIDQWIHWTFIVLDAVGDLASRLSTLNPVADDSQTIATNAETASSSPSVVEPIGEQSEAKVNPEEEEEEEEDVEGRLASTVRDARYRLLTQRTIASYSLESAGQFGAWDSSEMSLPRKYAVLLWQSTMSLGNTSWSTTRPEFSPLLGAIVRRFKSVSSVAFMRLQVDHWLEGVIEQPCESTERSVQDGIPEAVENPRTSSASLVAKSVRPLGLSCSTIFGWTIHDGLDRRIWLDNLNQERERLLHSPWPCCRESTWIFKNLK
jgi:hypothetical protein